MKIRFSKTDVIDTKNIEGGGADVSELEGRVDAIEEAPIYTVELTDEEVAYIKSFVEFVESCKDAGHPEIVFGKEQISGVSAITITADVIS